MKRTLFPKQIAGYVLYGIAAFVLLCTFTQYCTSEYLLRRNAQNLYRQSALISSNYAQNYYNHTIPIEDLQSQMSSLSQYISAEIWIVDSRGNLLLNSADSSVGVHSESGEEISIPGFDIGDFGNRYYQTGTFYDSFSVKTLSVFSPITVNYRIRGYVLIHKPLSGISSSVNQIMNISFYTVGIMFLLSFVFLAIYIFTVHLPLRKLTKSADDYVNGNFEQETAIHSNDEIGYLAKAMNYMAKELGTLEDDQRKFVSNVSHDFRSPLTSIKGYVEAMLDGTIPPEMQEKYLNIILYETERLNKLTQSLLDLNQIGHRGMILDIADFDINQMIRTTIPTFEGTCSKKSISFDLVLTGKELFVTGDLGKIQQVLYNLIDNAVKFSNNNSAIKIETSIKNEKVFISVKDSGIGVPSDSIKKIWNRFYKTDLSRGKDKYGTGLGLSIVKEIIQAHKENIDVISTEGVGTEFIFTLPLSKKET